MPTRAAALRSRSTAADLRVPDRHLPMRDRLAGRFRRALYRQLDFVPLFHQAEWQLALDGWILEPSPLASTAHRNTIDRYVEITEPDLRRRWYRAVPRLIDNRQIPARVAANLAAFKTGKSKGSAMWLAGFAAVPQCRIQLLGLEYDICVPEFEYLADALLSGVSGLGLRARRFFNQPKAGRMLLELETGARFECRSWERKDILKGKEIDVYLACEGYMFPGLEVYTSISQNLRKRDGLFLITTTPDRPWVSIFHDRGHLTAPESDPRWHCTCNTAAEANPHTFVQADRDRDDPAKGGLMTREQFAVAWQGRLGHFVGRVYAFQRGDRQFTPASHPTLWTTVDDRGPRLGPADLRLPTGVDVLAAVDTGTYMSGLAVAFDPDGNAFVLEEFPNYQYVSHNLELLDLSTPEWAKRIVQQLQRYRTRAYAWADPNTQFRAEVRRYGLHLLSNLIGAEARTEIAREYFQTNKVFLAPWLRILPYELEHAAWPPTSSASGKFGRVKRFDHTLDCLEHILSRRPRGKVRDRTKHDSFKDRYLREQAIHTRPIADAHLGVG